MKDLKKTLNRPSLISNPKNSGFTLIELLISIFIISIIMASFIPFYQKFGRRNALRAAANEVRNIILETQTLALAPQEIPDRFKENDKPYYYIFDIYDTFTNEERNSHRVAKILIGKIDVAGQRTEKENPPYEIIKTIELDSDFVFRYGWFPGPSFLSRLTNKLVFDVPTGKIAMVDYYSPETWKSLTGSNYTYMWVDTVRPISGSKKGRIELQINAETGQIAVGNIEEF